MLLELLKRGVVPEAAVAVEAFGDARSAEPYPWHDWRAHVPLSLVGAWPNLCLESRLAIYLTSHAITAWPDPSEAGCETVNHNCIDRFPEICGVLRRCHEFVLEAMRANVLVPGCDPKDHVLAVEIRRTLKNLSEVRS